MNDHTHAQIAPSGVFLQAVHARANQSAAVAVVQGRVGHPAANPHSDPLHRPPQRRGRRASRRLHTRAIPVSSLGAKGSLWENKWNYNAWWQTGPNSRSSIYRNDFSPARRQNAFDVVSDPTTGLPACRSVVNGTDPNCVPYDIFHTGGVTQAALNYLQTPGFQGGTTSRASWASAANSDLGAATAGRCRGPRTARPSRSASSAASRS